MKQTNRIKEMREIRGLSQEELAKRLNTFNQQISHLELGKRRLTWEWMLRIADVLECQPTDLVHSAGEKENAIERRLLDRFRELTSSEQETVQKMADLLAEAKTAYRHDPKPRKK